MQIKVSQRAWSSKLGPLEEIEHSLDGLTGDVYGKVIAFLKRSTEHEEP